MADDRIEQAFAALQLAYTEAHKRDATAAFVASVALARRLLSEVIEADSRKGDARYWCPVCQQQGKRLSPKGAEEDLPSVGSP